MFFLPFPLDLLLLHQKVQLKKSLVLNNNIFLLVPVFPVLDAFLQYILSCLCGWAPKFLGVAPWEKAFLVSLSLSLSLPLPLSPSLPPSPHSLSLFLSPQPELTTSLMDDFISAGPDGPELQTWIRNRRA